MSKLTINTQCKRCRRAGEKLFLKGEKCQSGKCILVKRNFPPGAHGANKKPQRLTNYGKQLLEKQKAKRIYGLRERQFKNYFEQALKKTGNTSDWLFKFLESRLDNTVYRLGFAPSRRQARQLVSHGHFIINGKKVDIPSYQIKAGELIALKPRSQKLPAFSELASKLEKAATPPWLSLQAQELSAKVIGQPKIGEVAVNVDWRVIIEFYSK